MRHREHRVEGVAGEFREAGGLGLVDLRVELRLLRRRREPPEAGQLIGLDRRRRAVVGPADQRGDDARLPDGEPGCCRGAAEVEVTEIVRSAVESITESTSSSRRRTRPMLRAGSRRSRSPCSRPWAPPGPNLHTPPACPWAESPHGWVPYTREPHPILGDALTPSLGLPSGPLAGPRRRPRGLVRVRLDRALAAAGPGAPLHDGLGGDVDPRVGRRVRGRLARPPDGHPVQPADDHPRVGRLGARGRRLCRRRRALQHPQRATTAELVRSGESDRVEFKSTARVNLHTGAKDDKMEQVVAKTLAAFLNTDGGTLVIGVDDGHAARSRPRPGNHEGAGPRPVPAVAPRPADHDPGPQRRRAGRGGVRGAARRRGCAARRLPGSAELRRVRCTCVRTRTRRPSCGCAPGTPRDSSPSTRPAST